MIDVYIRQSYDGFTLDAGFTVPAGITALFGRSGSGKSTVIRAIAGLFDPQSGRISIGDEVLYDSAAGISLPAYKRRIGTVFQDGRLFPHLTVDQNLDYGARYSGGITAAHKSRIVEVLDIGPLLSRRPATLSGGEVSRVSMGRAILSRPRLLLLDEPLAALDEARKLEILPYLEHLRDAADIPMIYVSHAMSEVARLAQTIVVMGKGKVLTAGPLGDILSDPAAAPLLGLRDAGSVLQGVLSADRSDGLARFDTDAGTLWLPDPGGLAGSKIRLRILAQDVMIATTVPVGISALNILPATIDDIRRGDGPGAVLRLRVGSAPILARITGRSVAALGLQTGQKVFAILKAVSIAPENMS